MSKVIEFDLSQPKQVNLLRPKVDIFDFNLLLVIAFAADLITPIFIYLNILPASVRWFSQGLLLSVIALLYLRMMAFDQVPFAVWAIAGISALGVAAAFFHGQGLLETAWGWWKLFEFPLMGLYVYVSPTWSRDFSDRLIRIMVWILGIEVAIQIVQAIAGEPIGDHLAGTFGSFGVGPLLLLIAFTLCLAMGRWLASDRWKLITFVLASGIISSVLGSMRIFPLLVIVFGVIAITLYALRTGRIFKLTLYAGALMAAVVIFGLLYNQLVPSAKRIPFEAYLQPERLSEIFSRYNRLDGEAGVRVDVGRNYALAYVWQSIQRDPITFAIGLGLGARGESVTLGTAGVGFLEDTLGQQSRTSLLVIIQEMGMFGILLILGFTLWICTILYRDIQRFPHSKATELRYALLLFSVLWPLWLWYKTVLTFRVPMLLYWVCLGYVLREALKRNPEMYLSEADASL
ncbi:MAG: hypothetical protein IIC78_08920 [Chloroflexi bacterium]|nr:hypothetical protein [Chloroflexota bacterium]